MNTHPAVSGGRRGLSIILATMLSVSLLALAPAPLFAAEESPAPAAVASAEPSLAPADALCQSAANLRLVVEFLRGVDVEEDGWLPVVIGGIAGLGQARDLLEVVGPTYRPLVDDLVVALQGLQASAQQFSERETTGAGIAAIGEAIVDVGNAMDALSVQLREPCPVDGEDA